ncbi:hypothetical protein Clacol_003872 [Clathrus columnatus]|uniref:FMR1-interacting protein 1 conserved domain-containing protein n=1 Tax=Clathrus columnatus TaxID=1419009 RepID=A0AAV5A858_9AGAM|nr:hypothetical protein Clacol_003872 [Clathrus columnatus]
MHPSQRGQESLNPSNFWHSYTSNVYSNPTLNNNLGARAAHALTSALADPYGQMRAFYSYTNSNYAQAYFNQMRMQQQRPLTTEEGYTLSSTYDPSSDTAPNASTSTSSLPGGSNTRNPFPNRTGKSSSFHNQTRTDVNHSDKQHHPQRRMPAPGDIRCTHPGCQFSGPKQTVEIHKMDRHLIYPPGWKKKTDDWDADPSLKGKPIPILGTGLVLNTQESIDAWIAERKKKWPSKQNIEERKTKEQEAEERGQINPSDLVNQTAKGLKRRRTNNSDGHRQQRFSNSPKRAKMTHAPKDNEKNNSWHLSIPKAGSSEEKTSPTIKSHNPINPETERFVSSSNVSALDGIPETVSSSSNPDDDDNESNTDIDPIKDAVSSKRPGGVPEEHPSPAPDKEHCQNILSTLPKDQAIHFLVENDCLNGVELKPGDADAQLIRVVEDQNNLS